MVVIFQFILQLQEVKLYLQNEIIIKSLILPGSLAIVKFLVEQFGTRYAEENDNNHTKPVYYAAQNGN